MKVALVYDRVNKWGGAERVLLALHDLFPDAPLYTSVYNKKTASWANVFDVKTSFLQNCPKSSSHELYAALMPLAFESFSFDEYDLVISVTSEAAKGIITKPKTLHICYCLTPTRYLWSGYDEYFKNPILRFFSKPAVSYLKAWDKIAAQRPDIYIAISKEVKERIKKYYGRESEVIYPPVARGPAAPFPPASARSSLSAFGGSNELRAVGSPSTSATPRFENNYFLIVSRLVPYKRIDIAVKAFNKLKLPLKIVGVGSEEKKLRSMSDSNIEFLGYLTDKELLGYYMNCRALVFPGLEDFGITILEAQGFGKPVIAYRAGGALETIVQGKTGEFFYPQTEEALIKTLERFDEKKYERNDCIKNAERFSFDKFKKQFLSVMLNSFQHLGRS